ncbi:MAG: YqiA/YcfP family alpha/beta fold hydrolase [Flavobacterium sp.]
MPGLAASSKIFERIDLPKEEFEMFFLEWIQPLASESISTYAQRMIENIKHDNPVLIGVSFGGILVQEISKIINVRKVIIISSVKTRNEFPLRMKWAKSIKAYKILPTGLVSNIDVISKFSFGDKVNQRIKLYEKFIDMRDKHYLDWALETIMLWDREVADHEVVHIHGDDDDVFPIKYIKDCIILKGGTHIMIINRYKWLNENLPKIILEENNN